MSRLREFRIAVGFAAACALCAGQLLGAVTTATAVPFGAVHTSVGQGVPPKKPKPAAKPRISYDDFDYMRTDMYQDFTLRLTGKWKGPVTVTAYTDTFQPQVLKDVRDGQVVTVQMAPAGAGFGCSMGTFEAEDATGQKAMIFFTVRYNT